MDSADLATPVDGKPWITEKEAAYDLETQKLVVAAQIGVFFKINPQITNRVGLSIFSQLRWLGPVRSKFFCDSLRQEHLQERLIGNVPLVCQKPKLLNHGSGEAKRNGLKRGTQIGENDVLSLLPVHIVS